MHYWLRLRPWYPRYAAALYAFALLLPVLALLGFTQAGREIDYLIARDPQWIEQLYHSTNALRPGQGSDLVSVRDGIIYGFWACLGAVLLARGLRHAYQRRRSVRITYPDARQVQAPRGFSVLEASRFAGIPHASVCGGRGRCSTCRIRVTGAASALPAASPAEQRLLERVGVPPNVRLACQLRPAGMFRLRRFCRARASERWLRPAVLPGRQERTIAVLFADLVLHTASPRKSCPTIGCFCINYFETVARPSP